MNANAYYQQKETLMRRVGQARKRDAIEAEVIDALESIGIDCWRLSEPGLGDVLTHSRGKWLPLEIKSGKGRLTPKQAELQKRVDLPIVRSVADALAVFGVTDR